MEILGIDIGGSGIKGAPVDIRKGVLVEKRHRIPTPQPSTPEAVTAVVTEIAQHFNWHGPIGCTFPAVLLSFYRTIGGSGYSMCYVQRQWLSGLQPNRLVGSLGLRYGTSTRVRICEHRQRRIHRIRIRPGC